MSVKLQELFSIPIPSPKYYNHPFFNFLGMILGGTASVRASQEHSTSQELTTNGQYIASVSAEFTDY